MRSPKRAGFTVVEVIVTLAIMAIALTTVVMTAKGRVEDAEAEALVSTLEAYRVATVNFREHVTGWPGYGRQLVYPPDAAVAPVNVKDDDICEIGFLASDIAAWRGPYLAQRLDLNGLRVGNALINNKFLRDPAGNTIAGELVIAVSQVDDEIATLVDAAIDGKPANFATGAVRFIPATDSLTYRVRIGGC